MDDRPEEANHGTMRAFLVALVVALVGVSVGCGSGGDLEKPTQCKRSDRTGTYRQTSTAVNGNCGELPTEVFRLESANLVSASPVTCTITNEAWSEGDCKLERVLSCTDTDGTSFGTAVSRQETKDGSVISGTITLDVRLKDGRSCRGTYDTWAQRQ